MTSSFFGPPVAPAPPSGDRRRPVRGLRGCVHRLAELHRRLRSGPWCAALMASASSPASACLQRLDRGLDALPCRPSETLSPCSLQRLLGRVDQRLGLVPGLDQLAPLLVLGGVRLGVLDHLARSRPRTGRSTPGCVICCSLPVALSFAETLTMPLASMSKVTSICGTPRGAGGMPTRSNWPSSLLSRAISRSPWKHVDRHRGLVVLGGREDLALLGRDRRVAVDQPREHAAQRLDAERQRRHVEQQHVLDVALQHAGLDRGADRHHLVRVDALVRLLAEELLHRLAAPSACGSCRRPGRPRRSRRLDSPASFERLAAGLDRLLDQVVDQLLELRARQLHRRGASARSRRP